VLYVIAKLNFGGLASEQSDGKPPFCSCSRENLPLLAIACTQDRISRKDRVTNPDGMSHYLVARFNQYSLVWHPNQTGRWSKTNEIESLPRG
jgi:hypothetical protein